MSGASGSSDCAFPSRTVAQVGTGFPTPKRSFGSTSANVPLATQSPVLRPRQPTTPCSATPNEVLLRISTQVLIPDYSSFYSDTPIQQFRMSYTTLPDGSLLASPYIDEVRRGDWTLLFAGMMLMLFIATSIISSDFIRRVKVKHKGLFYALLVSQLCGVLAFMITAATVLAAEIDCRKALIATGVFTELSSAILLAGILGVKAYRCLNDSKPVLSVIILLQAASSTMVFLNLAKLEASRKLSLTCTSTQSSILFPLSTTIRFVLALFICLCFIYAVWKSEKLPAAQGRISLSLSGQLPPSAARFEKGGEPTRPRGWWDYVPDNCPRAAEEPRVPTWHIVDDQGFVGNMRYLVGSLIKNGATEQVAKRKESEATLVASPRGHRRSKPSVSFVDKNEHFRCSIASRALSATSSKARSLGPLMDRMKLFRQVMKSELAYTASITLFNVIATILGLVGVFARTPTIDPNVFIGTYWGILSLLVLQSFRRVVHRHEREALLQHPSTWDPLYHVEQATKGEVRQVTSTASVSSNPWRARSTIDPLSVVHENVDPLDRQEGCSRNAPNALENPFEDFQFAGPPSDKGKDVDGPGPKQEVTPHAAPAIEPGSSTPTRSYPFPRRPGDDDESLSQWTESPGRDSASKYSVDSSQSLFYLEKSR